MNTTDITTSGDEVYITCIQDWCIFPCLFMCRCFTLTFQYSQYSCQYCTSPFRYSVTERPGYHRLERHHLPWRGHGHNTGRLQRSYCWMSCCWRANRSMTRNVTHAMKVAKSLTLMTCSWSCHIAWYHQTSCRQCLEKPKKRQRQSNGDVCRRKLMNGGKAWLYNPHVIAWRRVPFSVRSHLRFGWSVTKYPPK